MARTTDSDLTPPELRVLVAVADTGGFSAAAETLGLTQSAVSHSVRGSERKIGSVLFDRGRTGARPTPAGDKAVAYARRILRLLAILNTEARGAARSDAAEGPLRIAAFRSVWAFPTARRDQVECVSADPPGESSPAAPKPP